MSFRTHMGTDLSMPPHVVGGGPSPNNGVRVRNSGVRVRNSQNFYSDPTNRHSLAPLRHSREGGNPVRRIRAVGALYFLILSLFLALPAFADETAADEYTLSQAFLDTMARDARIQAAENRIAEARERLTEANSLRRPSLTVSGIGGYSHNRSEARFTQIYEGKSYRGRLNFNQNLYTFGRLAGRQRTAEAEIAEAEYAFEEVRQEVLAEVARAFSEQLFRERIYQSRRDFEKLLGDLEDTARSRIELGTLDRTELFEVLRRLHQARAQRIEASSHYRVARARLARLTGLDHENLAPTSLAKMEMATPADLEYALNQAESRSPLPVAGAHAPGGRGG